MPATIAIIMGSQFRLGNHAARGRDIERARRRLRRPHRLRPSHPGSPVRLRQGRQGGRLQDHHCRRRRCRTSAGHGGLAHGTAGVRRPRRVQGACRGSIRSTPSSRCRPAFPSARLRSAAPGPSMRRCWQPACWRSATRHSLHGLPPGARNIRTPSLSVRRDRRERVQSGEAEARRHHRNSGRRTVGPYAGHGGCAARPALPDLLAGPGIAAFDVVLNATCAEYADVEALEVFANDVDVITYEFENVPASAALVLSERRPVLPNRKILETTQDRLAEKDFVTRLGIGTAGYADVSTAAGLRGGRSRGSGCPPWSRPAASAMTARDRRSSATATIPRASGPSSAPNPPSSKPSFPSSAKFR